jgi:DNA-binding CsgD family transcriptional regulator
MQELRCPEHPDAPLRRRRTRGARGLGVYPVCVPADGSPRHVLAWDDAYDTARDTEVRVSPDARGATTLSPCELSVLCAAANGLTAAETARQLAKSPQTVKSQRRSVLSKLGARNATQAVCIATEQRLLFVHRGHGGREA